MRCRSILKWYLVVRINAHNNICRNNTISDPRFVMLCKLTKDPVLATKLLSESGAGLDLLELNPEVSSSS